MCEENKKIPLLRDNQAAMKALKMLADSGYSTKEIIEFYKSLKIENLIYVLVKKISTGQYHLFFSDKRFSIPEEFILIEKFECNKDGEIDLLQVSYDHGCYNEIFATLNYYKNNKELLKELIENE